MFSFSWLKRICAWALRTVTSSPKQKAPPVSSRVERLLKPRPAQSGLRMKSKADLAAIDAAQEKRDRKNAKRRGASQ